MTHDEFSPEDLWKEMQNNDGGFYEFNRKIFSLYLTDDFENTNKDRLSRLAFELLVNPYDTDVEGTLVIKHGPEEMKLDCFFNSEDLFWFGVACLKMAKIGGVDRKTILDQYKKKVEEERRVDISYMKDIKEKDLPPFDYDFDPIV